MGTKWFAAIVLLLFGGVSCRERVTAPQELLIVLPSASDVKRSPITVEYRVNDTYPASTTTNALVAAVTAKSCVWLPDDPFNPPPGFKFGAWDETKLHAKVWLGGWQCKGGVVVFSAISRQDGEPIEVKGSYSTDEQVKQIRKRTYAGR